MKRLLVALGFGSRYIPSVLTPRQLHALDTAITQGEERVRVVQASLASLKRHRSRYDRA